MERQLELPQAFADLGIESPILRALAVMSYETPSPIQEEMVPLVLEGKDVLGQARTGTGKTAAFGMPLLQMTNPRGRLQTLILAPTRELAAQVVGELRRIGQFLDIHCVPVYGGIRIKQQLHQLGRKPHVVVGTPGRVIDLLNRRALSFDDIRFVVLDEVDRMLDIGFRDDIRNILGRIKGPHQTVLVSATIDEEINRLARQFMNDPVEVNVSQDKMTVEGVAQYYCTVQPWDKFRLLKTVLREEGPKLAIVFCNTKHATRKLGKKLFDAGINAREIHGDLIQQKREKIMDRFRKQKIQTLVATDLAARGIDVHEVTHIINYDVPQDIEIYVHRVGRTARMGAAGMAITFVTPEQGESLTLIEMFINKQLEPREYASFKPSSRDDNGDRPPPKKDADLPEAIAKLPDRSAAPAKKSGPNLAGKHPLSRRRRRL